MTHAFNEIELPSMTFQSPSESGSPTSSDSLASFDFQYTRQEEERSKFVTLSLPSPSKSFCSTASACRICHEGDSVGPLTSPCECKGTIALVHHCCLEKWLTTSNTSQCEVCQYAFKVSKTSPPPSQWLSTPNSTTLFFDIICLLVFIPGGAVIAYLCTQTAIVYLRHGKWEGLGLLIVTAMLFLCFTVWIYFTLKPYKSSILNREHLN